MWKKLVKVSGSDGYTPKKGVDYFTKTEVSEMVNKIKEEATPKKGVDYKDGKSGRTPVKGVDYLTPSEISELKKQVKPIKGVDYEDGKDGSPDTPYEIRDKLSSLRRNERLDAKYIKNLDKQVGSLKITGMGGGTATSVVEHIADTQIHVPIYIQDTEPSGATLNDLWVDTSA